MVEKIISNIKALFYSETWYLILDKKINIFATKANVLQKWSFAEKIEFINHVGSEKRKQMWRNYLRVDERIKM